MTISSHYTCLCRDQLAVWRGNTPMQISDNPEAQHKLATRLLDVPLRGMGMKYALREEGVWRTASKAA